VRQSLQTPNTAKTPTITLIFEFIFPQMPATRRYA
jgi:hypothetical protein